MFESLRLQYTRHVLLFILKSMKSLVQTTYLITYY